MKKQGMSFAAGLLVGAVMFGGSVAYAAGITVERSNHRIFVNGQEVQMEAYKVNGSNYVKLRDIGKAVGFNVYWLDGVQIDSSTPYTGEAPVKEATPVEQPTGAKAGTINVDEAKRDIIERTNALRTEQGLSALAVNDRLMQAAQVRAEEMAASGVYSHTRPDGRKYVTVTDCKYVGENIHRLEDWALADRDLAETVIWSWSASAGHLKNMTNSRYGSIGIGLAHGTDENGQGCGYCVQLLMDTGCTISHVDKPATK